MKKVVVFSVLLVVLNLLLLNCNSVSAELGDILICDFDDVASGQTDFTSGYFDCERVDTGTWFETSTSYDLSTPNSLRVNYYNGVSNNKISGYMNLTQEIGYINSINFSFVPIGLSDAFNYVEMYFYDSDDHNVIKIKWETLDINWFDVSTGEHELYGSLSAASRYYIVITHNGTNQFNIKILNDTFVVKSNDDYAGNYAGTWTNFSYIYFKGYSDAGDHAAVYFDDFYFDLSGGSGDCYDVEEYDGICSGSTGSYAKLLSHHAYVENEFVDEYTGTIYGVDLPISLDQYNYVSGDVDDYWMYINGVPCGNPVCVFTGDYGWILRWYDEYGFVILSDERPLFSFYCDEVNSVGDHWVGIGINPRFGRSFSSEHGSPSMFIDSVFNGETLAGGKVSMCYYVNLSIDDNAKDDIPSSDLDDYVDLYGNEFIEFKYNDVTGPSCYYGLGYHPIIVYNLSDDNFTSTDLFYTYRIYRVGYNYSLYEGRIYLADVYEAKEFTVTDFTFGTWSHDIGAIGQYYILLLNSTDYGTTFDTSSPVYMSHTVTVCLNGVGPEQPGGGGSPQGGDYGDWYGIFAGFGVVVGFTLAPVFMFKNYSGLQDNIKYLMLLFGLFGLGVSVYYGLLPVWIVYVVGMVTAGFISLAIYNSITRS